MSLGRQNEVTTMGLGVTISLSLEEAQEASDKFAEMSVEPTKATYFLKFYLPAPADLREAELQKAWL
jgi:hypothetical protein